MRYKSVARKFEQGECCLTMRHYFKRLFGCIIFGWHIGRRNTCAVFFRTHCLLFSCFFFNFHLKLNYMLFHQHHKKKGYFLFENFNCSNASAAIKMHTFFNFLNFVRPVVVSDVSICEQCAGCEPCMATQHIKWQLIKMRRKKKHETKNEFILPRRIKREETEFCFLFVFSVRVECFSRAEYAAEPHIVPTIPFVRFDVSFSKAIKLKPNWWFSTWKMHVFFFLLLVALAGLCYISFERIDTFVLVHSIRFSENIFDFEKSANRRSSRNRFHFLRA